VKVGGRQAAAARASMDVGPDHVCAPLRAKRQKIYEVEVETKDGKKERFAGHASSPEAAHGHRVAHR